MAVRIELWTSDGLIDGAEHWWDDVEATLHSLDPTHEEFPLLSRIDPYGDATFNQAQLESLGTELRNLAAATSRPTVLELIQELIALCATGLAANASELRFVGD